MKKFVALMVVGLLAGPVMAGTIATPYTAGSMQGWDPGADPMTETFAGSDIWEQNYTGLTPGARYEYKITDGTWDNTVPGPNSWFYADGSGNITLTYDGNTYADGWSPTFDRLGQSTDPGSWTFVGDFLSELGGVDWTNNDANGLMTAMGGGVYHIQITGLPVAHYEGKFVFTGTWDSMSWDNRSVNSANWGFDITPAFNVVDGWVNAFDGTARLDVTPEPGTLALLGFGGLALLRRRR